MTDWTIRGSIPDKGWKFLSCPKCPYRH